MTKPGLAMPRVGPGHDVLPSQRLARGACPSLATPMQTGDGLLVRLRPSTPDLTLAQFRQLAAAVDRHGNGLIEITARGNLQLRGLSLETMPGLETDIAQAEIIPDTGLTIETPPLSGKDPTEIADARAMATRLRDAVAHAPVPLTLAPKLTVVVDGGGRLTLDDVTADIRLMAVRTADAQPQWLLAVGGTRLTAVPLLLASAEVCLATTLDLLRNLHALGPHARGRDLVASRLADQPAFPLAPAGARPSPSYVGIHSLGPKTVALGLRLAFGHIHARDLIAFLAIAEAGGIERVRTGPDHTLLLLGPSSAAIADVQLSATSFGFWTDASAPASHMATCSGAGGCASATYRTKFLAAALVDCIPDLLDGSIVLHLSGCPKGCAHPAESAMAIVGLPAGFGIVVRGKTSAMPVVIVDEDGLKAALQRVALMVVRTKVAGESVNDCLTRLGSAGIIAALRQE